MSSHLEGAAHPSAARPGRMLAGRYRLESLLGRGGMGEVWRARDTQLERDVAVKLPATSATDSEECERLLKEARIAASLNHPGIVAVHDAGVSEAQPFVVFEYVSGANLRREPPHGAAAVRAVADQVLEALEHVHAHGIVHRDLKPENLLWSGPAGTSRVKLADLGVARPGGSTTLTRNVIVGTAAYLAPEQATGAIVDGRADLYALGITLYEQLAGRTPFEGGDLLAVISQHLHAPVPPLRLHVPDVDPGLERFVLRLLHKVPAERFPDATAARAALAALADGTAPGTAQPATPILDQLVRGRLVGRSAELERLLTAWRGALEGSARLALISGEPGIGKSRLAREIAVMAHVDGAVVLTGGCYEFEATTPYLPFVEAISSWARDLAAESLRGALGDSAAELARLVPELDARLGPFPAPPALAMHEERLRLFEAIARFLRSLSRRRGLLVLLDDLHWADAGTLALLRHLMRQLRTDRVLLLGTYREVELDRRHPLAAALVDWERERVATRVALGRLSREETDALLATLLQQDHVTADFGEVMHRETEGNPFFTEEVVKALVEQGQIYREAGQWRRQALQDLAIPQSVKSAIGRRLDRLSETCAAALHVAAVLGKTFEFRDLLASSDAGEESLLDALDEATCAQLVQPLANESYAFTHDKIREVLVEELNPIRLRRLHLRVGELLEGREGAAVEDLAYHFQRGGDLARARRWLLAAGERARRLCALDEAADCLERACECAEGIGEPAGRLEALRALAAVQSARGELSATLAACEEALPLCTTDAERASVLVQAGEVCVRHGDGRGAEYLARAERLIDPVAQPREHVIVRALVARTHHYRMEHRRAIEVLSEVASLPIVREDASVAQLVLSFMAGAYQHLAEFATSLEWAQRCIDEGKRLGDENLTASGHEFAAEDLPSLGRFREALAHAEEDLRLGLRTGSLDRQAWALWCCAWSRAHLGELAAALEQAESCRRLCVSLGEQRLLCLVDSLVAPHAVETGRDELADELLAEAEQADRAIRQPFISAQRKRGGAHVAVLRGDGETALALARECLEIREKSDNRQALDSYLALGALGAALCGKSDEAGALARECLAVSDALDLAYARGWAHRALAALAARAGRLDEALAECANALAVHERAEARVDIARTYAERSGILRAAGRAAEADADRLRAREIAAACGAVRLLAELG